MIPGHQRLDPIHPRLHRATGLCSPGSWPNGPCTPRPLPTGRCYHACRLYIVFHPCGILVTLLILLHILLHNSVVVVIVAGCQAEKHLHWRPCHHNRHFKTLVKIKQRVQTKIQFRLYGPCKGKGIRHPQWGWGAGAEPTHPRDPSRLG